MVSSEPSRLVVPAPRGPGSLPGLAGAGDPTVPWQACSRQALLSRPHAPGVPSGIQGGATWAATGPPSSCARPDHPSRGSSHPARIPSSAGSSAVCRTPDHAHIWASACASGRSACVQRAGQASGISSVRAYAHRSAASDASAEWRWITAAGLGGTGPYRIAYPTRYHSSPRTAGFPAQT